MVDGAKKVLTHFMAVVLACTLTAHVARAAQPLACAGVGVDGVDPALPAYKPKPFELPHEAGYIAPDGAVVVVGYNDMREILNSMASTFSAKHRPVRFRFDLPGTRYAPAALAKGQSAFAPMGALFTPSQLADYRGVTSSEPLAIRIAHASLDPRALSGPLAVFVHRDNPIQSLTLAQVARVFAGEVTH
jgi:phosphate transport system substrate-binding protein